MANSSRGSDYSVFRSLKICGVSTAFLIFAIGIACLVVGTMGLFDENTFECGDDGKPPLIVWVMGTGVTFSIISYSFYRVSSGKSGKGAKWALGIANSFIVIWAIVGILSLLNYDSDCYETDPALWKMAWASVIASVLICCCGGIVGYSVNTVEAEIVQEKEVTLMDRSKGKPSDSSEGL